MVYYNPFLAMMPQTNNPTNSAAFQNFPGRQVSQPVNQSQPINQQQFRQFAATLNDQSLQQFAQLARQQGISEQDIQAGINFIKSL
jgi:hypothetical protein